MLHNVYFIEPSLQVVPEVKWQRGLSQSEPSLGVKAHIVFKWWFMITASYL